MRGSTKGGEFDHLTRCTVPLRLHAPTQYGYKQIKRIGLIAYTDIRRMIPGPSLGTAGTRGFRVCV